MYLKSRNFDRRIFDGSTNPSNSA